MPVAKKAQPLTRDEQEYLALGLQYLRAKGVQLSTETANSGKKEKIKWPVDPNGYFLKQDGKSYIPTEPQYNFIHSKAIFSLFFGSRGSGKTGAGAQKALRKIQETGGDGSVMNPDFANFKISTWPEFKLWLPWDLIVPSQRYRSQEEWEPHEPFVMVLKDGIRGVKIYCKGLKDPDSARGSNVNWLWYDEGGRDDTGLSFKIAVASVRIGQDPQAWVTESPKGFEHWSYRLFVKKEIPQEALDALATLGESDRILVDYFHGTIEQNKANLAPTFYLAMITTNPVGYLRAQEVDGEFANEGGQIGDRNWYNDRIVLSPPDYGVVKKIRFWDLAASEKKLAGPKTKDDPDETVGTLVSKFIPTVEFAEGHKEVNFKDPNFCLEHQIGGYWGWEKLIQAIVNTARNDGPGVEIRVEQEPAAGGKNQIAALKAIFSDTKNYPDLAGYTIKEVLAKDVGDRVIAANAYLFGFSSQGRVWLVRGDWNDRFLGQVDGFTQILHDDRVTSPTGAIFVLNPFKKWSKQTFVALQG